MEDHDSGCSRRGFLNTAVSGLLATGWAVLAPEKLLAQARCRDIDKPPVEIIYRTLGRTKLRLPIVSMGVMNADNPEIIKAAYEEGIRYFDTAAAYQNGRNEQMVGSVIEKLGVRDGVVIATKIGAPGGRRRLGAAETRDRMLRDVDLGLKRLKTDYIDILHIHAVDSAEVVADPAIMETLDFLKQQKKIRFTGVSTHSNMSDVINAVTRGGFYDMVLTAINFTMADETDLLDSIRNAAASGVAIVAMKTQAGGRPLSGAGGKGKYNSTVASQAALKWVLRNENISTAIPGFDNYQHLKEDFSVAHNLEYTPEEKRLLSDNDIILSYNFCRQCRQCIAACSHQVEIPELMRAHMYAAQYANFHQARATLAAIPEGRNLAVCRSCGSCTAECGHSLDIGRKLEDLKTLYA